ncbi:PTS sugar transporter subunit IIA [Loigolactobacillus zhaoyuanensis]|uniref:PTS sugar transporter subunit IIA n=1 Tax=Loigolactobacillus zhaoyuanensis TaxID=2486017 RepID=A0ABW8UEE5_9LACO|nr:PTS sugar transporter subunit IIA [Loigolactobacillus zhaoyuanensis]
MSDDTALKVSDYLREPLILLNTSFNNTDELFTGVNEIAFEKGFVTDQFLPKIKARESTFPTGLQLEDRGVAIPHTDADTIKKEFVAIVVNQQPISFKRMDDPESTTPVKVAFVLGLNQPHAQLEMLQSLMGIIQDKAVLDKLETASNKQEVQQILN